MSGKKKTIILIIVFIVVMAGAFFGYSYLSKRYSPKEDTSETQMIAAPDFTVYNADGEPVKLSDFKGSPVVLNFWATWCTACKSGLVAYNKIYDKYKDRVNFMMINMTDGARDTVDGAKAFAESMGYKFPVYFDTEYNAAMVWGISSIPVSVFINADGFVTNGYIGALSEAQVEECIQKMLGE